MKNNGKKREDIQRAALRLIVSSGVGHISTSAVFRAAGVSRTTLYRHFPTRQDLLEGVIEHIADEVERKLRMLIAEKPAPSDRLDLIVDLALELQTQNVGQRLLKVDPGFVMQVLDRTLQRSIDIFNASMADIYEDAEALMGRPVNFELVGNVMQRLFATLQLLPTPPLPGDFRQVIGAVFRALLFDARLAPASVETASPAPPI